MRNSESPIVKSNPIVGSIVSRFYSVLKSILFVNKTFVLLSVNNNCVHMQCIDDKNTTF